MERQQAYDLVRQKIKNKNLLKHCLAVEAIMRATAKKLAALKGKAYDTEKWALAGLVHDIDYETTKDDPQRHSIEGANMLASLGFDEDITYAVKAHNQVHGYGLKNDLDICLYAADPLSGLIVASALIKPEKRLDSIDTGFIMNRFKEKLFAKGANRKQIKEIEKTGISLKDFIDTALEAMKAIDKDLGL